MPHRSRYPAAEAPPTRPESEYLDITRGFLPFTFPGAGAVDPSLQAFIQALGQALNSSSSLDAAYNLAAISNPTTYALLFPPKRIGLTPVATTANPTGVAVYTNTDAVPHLVVCRMQMIQDDTSVYLYLALDENTSASQAAVGLNSSQPFVSVVVPASRTLFVGVTAQTGSTAVRNVIISGIPLRGRGILGI